MTENEFWALIEETRPRVTPLRKRKTEPASNEPEAKHVANLIDHLTSLKTADIQSFEKVAVDLIQRADTSDLRNAVAIALQGGGDDGFLNFCGWLILQGKPVFDKVVAEPDNLADHFSFMSSMESEEFLTAALAAQQRKGNGKTSRMPLGNLAVRHSENEEAASSERFPRLTARVNKAREKRKASLVLKNAVQWDQCEDFLRLWELLERKNKDQEDSFRRRRRLLACGCCRKIWPSLSDQRSRNAVEVSERFADGLATRDELVSSVRAAAQAFEEYCESGSRPFRSEPDDPEDLVYRSLEASCDAAYRDDEGPPSSPANTLVFCAALNAGRALGESDNAMIDVLKDVFGNPFAQPELDAEWLNLNKDKFMPLAKAIYERREFDRLPELADVLEASGFADRRVLDHLRSKGFHVRGCWALDIFLGDDRLTPKSIPTRKKKPT